MHIGLFVKDFAVGTQFNKDGLPTKSGAEFHAENHARELIRLGHRVTVFAKKRFFRVAAREDLEGIDLVRLHAPWRGGEILARLLTTHRDIDAFYIIGVPKFGVWPILFSHWRGKPVTLALTGKAEIFSREDNWRTKIFSRCSRYVATTQEIARGFVTKGGIDKDIVTVLAHGINTAKYPQPDAKYKAELKARHGLAPETPVLLFCARVVLNKGIDTLQKIWPLVHEKCPQAQLFVVGGGKFELISALEAMGRETGNSVTVTGEQEQPQEFYQMADVYVFPSRHEGLPISLLEAMSSGLPAVVSDIGGCEDLIFDGETGFRVYSEDAGGFAGRILYLFAHPQEAEAMGANGARYVREHCDYQQVIPRLEQIVLEGVQQD